MQCERCSRNTDIIKRVRITRPDLITEMMICVPCYNNRPKFYVKEIEEIRNDKMPQM